MSRKSETGRVAAGVVLVGALLAGCAAESVFGPRLATLLETREVYSSQHSWSGFEDPVRTLITDDVAWAEAWATLHEGVTPQPPLPAIDFEGSVLVLAGMGMRPTGGYRVTIESVRAHEGVLYVTVRERSPGPTCGTYQALTQPVHVLEVPRQGLTAEFQVRRSVLRC
jgi:hypothetical protein